MQEGSYAEAASKFQRVKQSSGSRADALYSLAACQYKLKDYKSAVVNCTDVISSAVKDHPGRSIGRSLSVTLQIFHNSLLLVTDNT